MEKNDMGLNFLALVWFEAVEMVIFDEKSVLFLHE